MAHVQINTQDGREVTASNPLPVTAVVTAGTAIDTELTTADLDTGAGTDTRAVVGLVLAESGGGLLVGSAHPIPVSLPTATVTTLTPPAAITGFATETTLALQSAKLPATLGQKAMAASLAVTVASDQSAVAVTPAAGELHLGEVGQNLTLTDFTLVLDTNIYASGDVLSDTAAISGVFRVTNGKGTLTSLVLIDEDDQGVALDVYFYDAAGSLGTFNQPPSISDANARNFLGKVSVFASDWDDLGGVRVAAIPANRLGFVVKAVSAATSLGIATITRGGTPTYTASGIRGRIGVECN